MDELFSRCKGKGYLKSSIFALMLNQLFYTKRITKWLFAAGLLYSSLIFSVFKDNLPPKDSEVIQNEQLDSDANSGKSVVSYWLALEFSKIQFLLSKNILHQKSVLLNSLWTFKQQSFVAKNRLYSFEVNHFFRRIMYPNDSEETISSFLIG